jgi:hypothetical protein
MMPVYQTTFGDGRGNCFAACLASILEIPLESVPNFCVEYPDRWFWEACSHVGRYGYGLVMIGDGETSREVARVTGAYSMVGGRSPRGEFAHSVVYRGLEMAHDPHPDGAGIAGGPEDWTFLIAREPKNGRGRLAV